MRVRMCVCVCVISSVRKCEGGEGQALGQIDPRKISTKKKTVLYHNVKTLKNVIITNVKSILVWRSQKRQPANSADPDQTSQIAASDQGLQCLQLV